VGEERKVLLHELASREVCGYAECPSRMRARQHAREMGFVSPAHDDRAVMDGAPASVEVKA
jgi:hypothetical protein